MGGMGTMRIMGALSRILPRLPITLKVRDGLPAAIPLRGFSLASRRTACATFPLAYETTRRAHLRPRPARFTCRLCGGQGGVHRQRHAADAAPAPGRPEGRAAPAERGEARR